MDGLKTLLTYDRRYCCEQNFSRKDSLSVCEKFPSLFFKNLDSEIEDDLCTSRRESVICQFFIFIRLVVTEWERA